MHPEDSPTPGASPVWHEAAQPKLAVGPIRRALDYERQVWWAIAVFPLFAVMLIAMLKLASPWWYMVLNREDGVVEWMTAAVYLVAAGFAASLVLSFRRRKENMYALLCAGLGIGMVFIAMEEISWGQRLFGIATPDFVESINMQGEVTLHNVRGFPVHEAYIAVGLYGAFARTIATLLLGGRHPKLVSLVTPPPALFLYFFVPFLLYAYYQFIWYTELVPYGLEWGEYWTERGGFLSGDDQESIELLLSFGFLLFTLVNWVRYRVGAPFTLGRLGDPRLGR